MAKGKAAPKRRKRRASSVMEAPTDPQLMAEFVVEFNHIAQDFFLKLGVTAEQYRRASLQSHKIKSRKRPSAALVATITGSGDVMSMWRRDRRFINRDGSPRVIPIRGKGATFETLARKCVPQVPAPEVLKYICSHGGATVFPDDRVALSGQPAILTRRTPETTAAWMLAQVRYMAQTVIHNTAFAASQKGVGFFQRTVHGYLAEKDFDQYAQAVRPTLQSMCEQLEAGLALTPQRGSKKNAQPCGIGLFVFRDTGTIG